MLGVTCVVPVLSFFGTAMIPYRTSLFTWENLSRIVEASLFKMDHSQTQKGPFDVGRGQYPSKRGKLD
jgi:hypothetical protein